MALDKATKEIDELIKRQPHLAKYRDENITKLHGITQQLITLYPVTQTDAGFVIYNPTTRVPRYYIRHTEIPFSLPIANGAHTIIGSIDAVVENEHGHWRIWEMKTSSLASDLVWQRQWRLSTQPKTYEYVAQVYTKAVVLGTFIVPFNTKPNDVRGEPIIEIEHTPAALDRWLSNTITYLDWLESIATEVGITFDSEGRAHGPSTYYQQHEEEFYRHCQHVLSQLIPTGSYTNACSNRAYGTCQYYGICATDYNPGYIRTQTMHNIWNPLEVHG
jgi:hypothetical protein